MNVALFGCLGHRDKWSHPYNYDPYLIFGPDPKEKVEVTGSMYSDRMYQWGPAKYNAAATKVFGDQRQVFHGTSPEQFEQFLCAYLEKPVKLVRVIEHCNQATGFPLWYFDYLDLPEAMH